MKNIMEKMEKILKVCIIGADKDVIRKLFKTCEVASSNGGFWISTAGGTINVASDEFALQMQISYEEARVALIAAEIDELFTELFFHQGGWDYQLEPDEYRFDVRTIVRAACKNNRSASPVVTQMVRRAVISSRTFKWFLRKIKRKVYSIFSFYKITEVVE